MKWVYTARGRSTPTLPDIGQKRTDVVLDADLSSSTRTSEFAKKFPERFFNVGIAEQTSWGPAATLPSPARTVFASTFAASPPADAGQIRQSIAYPNSNVKIAATHAGITVGVMEPRIRPWRT